MPSVAVCLSAPFPPKTYKKIRIKIRNGSCTLTTEHLDTISPCFHRFISLFGSASHTVSRRDVNVYEIIPKLLDT